MYAYQIYQVNRGFIKSSDPIFNYPVLSIFSIVSFVSESTMRIGRIPASVKRHNFFFRRRATAEGAVARKGKVSKGETIFVGRDILANIGKVRLCFGIRSFTRRIRLTLRGQFRYHEDVCKGNDHTSWGARNKGRTSRSRAVIAVRVKSGSIIRAYRLRVQATRL